MIYRRYNSIISIEIAKLMKRTFIQNNIRLIASAIVPNQLWQGMIFNQPLIFTNYKNLRIKKDIQDIDIRLKI